MVSDRLTDSRGLVKGFAGVFVGALIYNLILAPLFTDEPYLDVVESRLTERIVPWGVVCFVLAVLTVAVLGWGNRAPKPPRGRG